MTNGWTSHICFGTIIPNAKSINMQIFDEKVNFDFRIIYGYISFLPTATTLSTKHFPRFVDHALDSVVLARSCFCDCGKQPGALKVKDLNDSEEEVTPTSGVAVHIPETEQLRRRSTPRKQRNVNVQDGPRARSQLRQFKDLQRPTDRRFGSVHPFLLPGHLRAAMGSDNVRALPLENRVGIWTPCFSPSDNYLLPPEGFGHRLDETVGTPLLELTLDEPGLGV